MRRKRIAASVNATNSENTSYAIKLVEVAQVDLGVQNPFMGCISLWEGNRGNR